jgi:hypothetical protein
VDTANIFLTSLQPCLCKDESEDQQSALEKLTVLKVFIIIVKNIMAER